MYTCIAVWSDELITMLTFYITMGPHTRLIPKENQMPRVFGVILHSWYKDAVYQLLYCICYGLICNEDCPDQ